MWLKKLKTALILEDFERLSALLDEMPQFETLQQMEEASYLLMHTAKLILRKKQSADCTYCNSSKTVSILSNLPRQNPLFPKSQILTLFSPFF
jgi:hypothetical protein